MSNPYLFNINSKESLEISLVIHLRLFPHSIVADKVVPAPANGSNIIPPAGQLDLIIRLRRLIGF